MSDLTTTVNELLQRKQPNISTCPRPLSTETADEFLKEAYRINSHITSLLQYLHTIRPSYLSITTTTSAQTPTTKTNKTRTQNHQQPLKHLTNPDRDKIDTSTSTLLHNLSTSIMNLSAAETLRQETHISLLDRKYGRPSAAATKLLFRWAGGASALSSPSDQDEEYDNRNKSAEQLADEAQGKMLKSVRESVLWFLRRRLEGVVEVQRDMVERRIERAREKEKSVLYKSSTAAATSPMTMTMTTTLPNENRGRRRGESLSVTGNAGLGARMATTDTLGQPPLPSPSPSSSSVPFFSATGDKIDEAEVAAIESELTPEQLQLFAEENDSMIKYYEDTLSKVQNAEKSLLEISSLQQTLVSHLSTQEEYITQLVSDAANTETNIGRGNKELKRATERRSAAQAVFWGTVGLCTWLVVWDLVF